MSCFHVSFLTIAKLLHDFIKSQCGFFFLGTFLISILTAIFQRLHCNISSTDDRFLEIEVGSQSSTFT